MDRQKVYAPPRQHLIEDKPTLQHLPHLPERSMRRAKWTLKSASGIARYPLQLLKIWVSTTRVTVWTPKPGDSPSRIAYSAATEGWCRSLPLLNRVRSWLLSWNNFAITPVNLSENFHAENLKLGWGHVTVWTFWPFWCAQIHIRIAQTSKW